MEAAANTFYDGNLAVQVEERSRHSVSDQVLRVLLQHRTSKLADRQGLLVRVTDDQDPFFLYSLELAERDFAELKREQGLKVDYAAFPRDCSRLLSRCADPDDSRYMCQLGLDATSGQATLNLVETNQFKNLVHLSLRLVQADDASVRQYLAQCLQVAQRAHAQLQTEHTTLQERHQAMFAELHGLQSSREQTEHHLTHQARQQILELEQRHQQHLQQCQQLEQARFTELEQRHRAAREQWEREAKQAQAALEAQVRELTTLNGQLREVKFQQDGSSRELSLKLEHAHKMNIETTAELTATRERLQQRDTLVEQQAERLASLQATVERLEAERNTGAERLQDRLQTLSQAQRQVEELKVELRQAQQHAAALERTLQSSVAEIHKGNGVISNLHHQLTTAGEREERLAHELTEAQEQITALQAEREKLRDQSVRTENELQQVRKEQSALEEALETARAEQQRLAQDLQTKESVLAWMNRQRAPQTSGANFLPSGTTVGAGSSTQYDVVRKVAGYEAAAHLGRSTQVGPSGTAKLAQVLQQQRRPLGSLTNAHPSSKDKLICCGHSPRVKGVQVSAGLFEVEKPELPRVVSKGTESAPAATPESERSHIPKPKHQRQFTTPPQKGPPSAMATPDLHRQLRQTNKQPGSGKALQSSPDPHPQPEKPRAVDTLSTSYTMLTAGGSHSVA
ncbi:uncharacterized protein MONBRDRAFT_29189 [Monosiga brevicollis MX1]|uniref:Spindle assembly abnormal protein 6 N-terminal domain-containing protein n=1 Tax=Monosiga brevicollis TaxID=81824 RepID=A9VAD4_MONBE|nr:uncharacterized protein MONBRDRAFT_29189 [Monosiga brevicollis MX1]EDQ85522.1 predicted protein [Monosiga brevicollis MX1]|eukprot:XP_001749713.1 hypothetical protein [Monosiga brevicollis MX1]